MGTAAPPGLFLPLGLSFFLPLTFMAEAKPKEVEDGGDAAAPAMQPLQKQYHEAALHAGSRGIPLTAPGWCVLSTYYAPGTGDAQSRQESLLTWRSINFRWRRQAIHQFSKIKCMNIQWWLSAQDRNRAGKGYGMCESGEGLVLEKVFPEKVVLE